MKANETSFYANFSVRQLVQQSESSAWLKCDPLGGGGCGHQIRIRRSGSGETHFNSHKSDNFACRMTSDESLDETRLFSALKLSVERALNENGAQITANGSTRPGNFYFAYILQGVGGRVELSSQRGEAGYYNISADLNETGSQRARI
jgi:hypothetical protein